LKKARVLFQKTGVSFDFARVLGGKTRVLRPKAGVLWRIARVFPKKARVLLKNTGVPDEKDACSRHFHASISIFHAWIFVFHACSGPGWRGLEKSTRAF
jgi:hypothetical protein